MGLKPAAGSNCDKYHMILELSTVLIPFRLECCINVFHFSFGEWPVQGTWLDRC